MTENLCDRCGKPARVFELVGTKIPMRYCDPCADALAAAEEAAERARSLDVALRQAGATPRLLEQTLASHPSPEHRAKAEGWLAGYRRGDRRNLYLGGPVGVGKSGLAWGIVRELVTASVDDYWASDEEYRGYEPYVPAALVRWADLLDDLKAAFDADRRALDADPSALLERAKRVRVLALDDVGRERPTPYAVEKLANLVEERYHGLRPTVVTSNYSTKELAARLGAETGIVDGERIVSRLVEGAVGVRMEGPSRRRAA